MTGRASFRWEGEQQQSFEALVERLTSPPVLSIPTSEGKFVLDTDASDLSIGGELSQIQDGQERTIASAVLCVEQRHFCTTREKLCSVVKFTRQFSHYLLGRHFTVRTDHHSLTWLVHFRHPNGQIARWLEELSQYNMKIEHRPGKKHVNADALSREIVDECKRYSTHVPLADLPCGGCKYCTRAHEKWQDFAEKVDDVIPLILLSEVV